MGKGGLSGVAASHPQERRRHAAHAACHSVISHRREEALAFLSRGWKSGGALNSQTIDFPRVDALVETARVRHFSFTSFPVILKARK